MVFSKLHRSQKILLASSFAIIQAVTLSFDTALAQTQTHPNLNKKCSGAVKISYAIDQQGDRDLFQDLQKEKSLESSNLNLQPSTYFGQPKISESIYQIDTAQKLKARPFQVAFWWCCPCPNPFRPCCYC